MRNGVFNKALSKLKLVSMTGPKGRIDVEIKEIPKKWEYFLESENQWINIDMPESERSSACLYKAKEDDEFLTHRHVKSGEQMTIVNEGGSFILYTERGFVSVEYPNSVFIPANEWHALKFTSDTTIMIIWCPKFKEGWDASFKDEKL